MRMLLLLALLLALCGSVFAQAPRPLAPPDTDNVTQGCLRVREPDGDVVECPLKHTDVKVDISGFIARVKVTQTFYNPYDDKIEAVYVFPLSNTGAVDSMTMLVGDRRIIGQIKKRADARAIYEAALRQGVTASLLEQERPNIFTQSVGNIKPKQAVEVEITYIDVLKYDLGSYEFHFPMVVAPRYMPGAATGQNGTGWSPDTDKVPDASRISPPVLKQGQRNGHDISLTLALDAGVPIQGIHTSSHKSNITPVGDAGAKVMLLPEDSIPNKDFILRYKVAGKQPEMAILAHKPAEGDGYFMLMLQPCVDPELLASPPREMVFLIDKSGSMDGQPTAKVKEIMRACFKRSRPDDTVQVIAFSDTASALFDKPVPASPENIARCLNYTDSLQGGGGTEMMNGIKLAFDPALDPKRDRVVVLVTDAEVGNDDEIINAVAKKANSHLRVWTFGVGNAPNRHLIDNVAKRGGGKAAVIDLNTDPDQMVGEAMSRIYKAQLEKITIDWGGVNVYDVLPRKVPDLWAGAPVILFGKYAEGAAGTVTINGMADGKPLSFSQDVSLPYSDYANHDVLPQVWARQKIDDLTAMMAGDSDDPIVDEITQVALDYHLMSQYTSMVAVDESEIGKQTEPATPPRRIAVAVPMPDGMSYTGVFGGMANYTFSFDGDKNADEEVDGRALLDAPMAGEQVTVDALRQMIQNDPNLQNKLRGPQGAQGPQGAPGGNFSAAYTGPALNASATKPSASITSGYMVTSRATANPVPPAGRGKATAGTSAMGGKAPAAQPPAITPPSPATDIDDGKEIDFTYTNPAQAKPLVSPAMIDAMRKEAAAALADAAKLLKDGKLEEALLRAQYAVFLSKALNDRNNLVQAVDLVDTIRKASVESYVKIIPELNKPLGLVLRNKSLDDAFKAIIAAGGLRLKVQVGAEDDAAALLGTAPRIQYLDLRNATAAQAFEWILTPNMLTWRVENDARVPGNTLVAIGVTRRFSGVAPWVYSVADMTTPTMEEWKRATKQNPPSTYHTELLRAVRAEIGQKEETALTPGSACYADSRFLLVYGDKDVHTKVAALLAALRSDVPLKGYEGLQTTLSARTSAWGKARDTARVEKDRSDAIAAMRQWSWALLADAYNGQVDDEALTGLQSAWASAQVEHILAGSQRLVALRSAWALCRAARRLPDNAEINILARLAYGKVGRQFAALTKALGVKPADAYRYTALLYATLVAQTPPDGAGKPEWSVDGAESLLLAIKDVDPLRVVARGLLDPKPADAAALAGFFRDGKLNSQDLLLLGTQAAALARGATWQTARQNLPNLLNGQRADGQLVVLLTRMSARYEMEWAKK